MTQLKLICPAPDRKSKKGTALDAVSHYAFWLLQLLLGKALSAIQGEDIRLTWYIEMSD